MTARSLIRRAGPWTLLLVSLALLYQPELRAPIFWDDLDFFAAGAFGDLGRLWTRCLLPHYFRPLAAPLFWLLQRALGRDPVAYRLVIVLLHAATAFGVYRTSAAAIRSRSAAFWAAALYSLCWIHWAGPIMISNLGQAACDALFWQAVAVYATGAPGALARTLGLGTLAVLFKEHAVVLPAFAVAAAWDDRPRPRLMKDAAALALWSASYVLIRLLLPQRFDSPQAYYPLELSGLWSASIYLGALRLLLEPWLPSAPLELPSAAAGALAVGWLACGWTWGAEAERPRLGAGARLAAVGALAGLAPYAAFRGALVGLSPQRMSLACGALAIGLAAAICAACARLAERRHENLAGPVCGGLLLAAIFLRTAAAFGDPDPWSVYFSRWAIMQESARYEACLRRADGARRGDSARFAGFADAYNMPALWSLAAESAPPRTSGRPGLWRFERGPQPWSAIRVVRPDGSAWLCRQEL